MTEYPANLPMKNLEDLACAAGQYEFSNLGVSDPTEANNNRARWAAHSVHAYAKHMSSEDVEMAISDLIGDVIHLCDAAGLDFDDIVHTGYRNHDEELVTG